MPIIPTLVRQAGVVAVRGGQVCLVTTRGGKRWVVPKGCMEPNKSATEIALQEAWEEAGLVGLVRADPLGSYFYEKDGMVCHVILFMMDVTGQMDVYPEMGQRQRVWLPGQQAVGRVDDPGLRDILRGVALPLAG
jgi:8-oxo-dGTP pyrophosphatase MutT (NUDIX family)